MVQLQCFAVVCSETRHIAELVARQKTSKKVARSQLVNCRLRAKPCDLYRLNGAEATLYTCIYTLLKLVLLALQL